MADKFFLIDGHSVCYKAFYALRNLSAPDGQPTNMVFGFATVLRKLLREHKPDYIAVAFDRRGPTFRHAIYPEYKANRKPPPDEFTSQLPFVQEMLDALRVPRIEAEGYEADDILGTAAKAAAEKGLETYLVTTDKDAEQLLGPSVKMYDSTKDEVKTVETLKSEKGIAPEQVADLLGLSGDSSDNIPGVPKIGPTIAKKLLETYGNVESVIAAAQKGEIESPTQRKNLVAHADDARLSRQLATICCDAPVEFDWDAMRVSEPDEAKLRDLYERLGFRQFLEEIGSAPTQSKRDYALVDSPEAFAAFMGELKKQKRFAVDTETTSQRPTDANLVGLSFSWEAGTGHYLPLRGPLGAQVLDKRATLDALAPILEDPEAAKIGQNIKYDMVVLAQSGIRLRGVDYDTMLAAYLLDPESRQFGLDELAFQFLGYRKIPTSDLIGKGAKQITMDQVETDRVCEYACEDADICWRLAEALDGQVKEAGLSELLRQLEIPLVPVLAEMELHGVRLNSGQLREMSEWLAGKIATLEKTIQEEAGTDFNPASPKQLAEVLFDKLNLPKGRRTKTGASTDAEVLEELKTLHPVPGLVLEYRQLVKLKNTYVDALPELVHRITGKLHTSFSQTATATGRLSSRDPNLQNIPVRTEIGARIRKAFVPSEDGWILMSADYSQIELRILAHLSGDRALRDAFHADRDIHRFVASQVYGVAEEDVSHEQRRAAKAVNFGIIYGLTAYGLSKDIGVPVKEADAFIAAYFERHPGVRAFIDKTLDFARENGYVATMRGRRRAIRDIAAKDSNRRSFAERAAVNTVVQGSAADMIKVAMIALADRLEKSRLSARMLLQIHDELLFECPAEEQEELARIVAEEMEKAMPLDVPVRVQVAVGPNWGEAK